MLTDGRLHGACKGDHRNSLQVPKIMGKAARFCFIPRQPKTSINCHIMVLNEESYNVSVYILSHLLLGAIESVYADTPDYTIITFITYRYARHWWVPTRCVLT